MQLATSPSGWIAWAGSSFTFSITRYHPTEERWYDNATDAATDQNRQRTISYSYDLLGQLRSVSDPSASYEFTPDDLGRTTTISQTIDGLAPTVTWTQQFDANGYRTQLSADIGGTADFQNVYTPDALGQTTRITPVGRHRRQRRCAKAGGFHLQRGRGADGYFALRQRGQPSAGPGGSQPLCLR